jgi:hypothetical protein
LIAGSFKTDNPRNDNMFKFNDFRTISSFGSNALHAFSTDDTKATIEGANYFDVMASYVETGDALLVSGDQDGTPFIAMYLISKSALDVLTLTEHAAVTQNVLQEISLPKISSKAADAEVFRFVPSFAGSITKAYSVLNAALATGDATFTLKINGNAVTNGVITAAEAGSAANDVDVATPTAANTFAAGDVISVTGGGASTATATANITLQLTPS